MWCCCNNDEKAHEHLDPQQTQRIRSSGGFPEDVEPEGFGAGKPAEDLTLKYGAAGGQHASDSGRIRQDNTPQEASTKNGEYTIRLDRTNGTRLGVDVDDQDGVSLLIDNVTGGLAEEWNNNNPQNRVVKGDRVVEVNGVRGNVDALVVECQKQQVISMKIMRAA